VRASHRTFHRLTANTAALQDYPEASEVHVVGIWPFGASWLASDGADELMDYVANAGAWSSSGQG
jgi:hypothetical protein